MVINDINFWGSPVSPYFLGMAFNKYRGTDIKKVWNKIPENTDILITHTPPFGILDSNLGCEDLLFKVGKLRPKYHLFGHIHQQNGKLYKNDTTFINAALVNNLNDIESIDYSIVSKSISFSI